MRDVDQRGAAVAQPAHECEQALDVLLGERGRGLVEDQDARLDRHGLGDLDDLPLRGGQMRRRGGRTSRSGQAELAEQRSGAHACAARQSIQPARRARQMAEQECSRSRESWAPACRAGAPCGFRGAGRRAGREIVRSAHRCWMWPASTPVAPVRMRVSVLLPAPFSPTSAWISPAAGCEVDAAQRMGAAVALDQSSHLEQRIAVNAHHVRGAAHGRLSRFNPAIDVIGRHDNLLNARQRAWQCALQRGPSGARCAAACWRRACLRAALFVAIDKASPRHRLLVFLAQNHPLEHGSSDSTRSRYWS